MTGNNGTGRKALSRRDVIAGGVFLGGTALLSTQVPRVQALMAGTAAGTIGPSYEVMTRPENILYTACLGCHTSCGAKARIVDGVLAKLDGNPYSAHNMLPQPPYETPPWDLTRIDGKMCPKGQAMIQTVYDPYRIRTVLKRAGKRGEGKWTSIPFDQAISEIVEGGHLFKHVPGEEDRLVEGLKDVWVLRDPGVAENMAKDVKKLAQGKLSVAQFKANHKDHLDTLIDPDHPDLGPRNNQFAFMGGRIQYGREAFITRWLYGGFGSINFHNHCTVCGVAHRCAHGATSVKFDEATGEWDRSGIPCYFQPDFLNSEFAIFFGANPYEANYGPTPFSERLTEGLASGRLKWAVVDPRLTKTAARAWKWIPVKPGEDAALIMGMIRWIIENERHDARFLANANQAAAKADGEPGWANATWLVKIDDEGPAAHLRGDEIGQGDKSTFVAVKDGQPVPFKIYSGEAADGDLFFDGHINGIHVKTAYQILWEEASSRTLDEWAGIADVKREDLEELAREFTSHGKKAVVESHRGLLLSPSGFHNTRAAITLNMLIGNYHWKGGIIKGGKKDETGGAKGQPYPVFKMHPGKLTTFGINMGRHGFWTTFYENSTLFEGYPAKRPWYPFQSLGGQWHEVLPSASAGDPYPLKALWVHMGTPIQSTPAAQTQLDVYADPAKMPLIWTTDPVLSEVASYADYAFPDTTYLERFDPYHPPAANSPQEYNPVRQPVITPLTDTGTVYGEEQHQCMEVVALAIAEKLGLPGYGNNGFGDGLGLTRPEDMYLKMVANIGWGHKVEENVPDASEDEIALFQEARRHLAPTVFDYERWQKTVAPELWPKVAFVLNRGGRWENFEDAWKGDLYAHPWPHTLLVYQEPMRVATRDSMTGERYPAWAVYIAPHHDSLGRKIEDADYPFDLITYKVVSRTNWRTDEHYWSMGFAPENTVDMSRRDADRLGFKDGQFVKLASASNPEGVWDFKNGTVQPCAGRLRVLEGIRPGVVAVSASFGHWFHGARDIEVDGDTIRGDPRRGTGVNPNVVMRADPHLKDICVSDHVGGNTAYLTKVSVVKA